ncbi:sialate O-acetylesterase [Eubacterium sp.]|uniref:sialate O-acetylesterase n=1 Tax=Eubacterium sp. TaxID=142586 RepID=UPI0025FA2B81|nr:sialate O-acetylesterase [Eubacterium sp.]MCR5629094.1 sialate O-acetylesterase [Eubacterium sp.]
MIRLSGIFTDGLILQRDCENLVYGYADASSDVKVELKKHKDKVSSLDDICSEKTNICFEGKTTSDLNGYFEIILPKIEAGHNYEMRVSSVNATNSCSEEIVIKDIAFGDVFLCGGQSNMQLQINRTLERYEEEIKNTHNEDIRIFTVPEKFNFHHTEDMIEGGNWVKAVYPDILDLGATAYFSAKHIYAKHGVPIGIYNTAIGGTPIKAWMSEESVRKLNLHVDEFEECLDDEFVKETIEREYKEDQIWREDAYKPYEELDKNVNISEEIYEKKLSDMGLESGVISLPGFFEGSLSNRCMSICLRKKVYVDEAWLKLEDDADGDYACKLYLGAIIDSDITYVNGERVGDTGYLYPPRIYKLKDGILKPGENTIEVRMVVFRNEGGFMPDMDYYLKNKRDETISLEGEWEYTVVKDMPYIENLTFFSYKPAGVFNAMIYPLRKQKVKSVLFYQGESNIEEYENYKIEFETAINDWRKAFAGDIPFIYVQIAGFSEGKIRDTDLRARLADEQYKCLDLPKTAMVQAYDLGEYNELHPTNKNEVGRRISEAVEKVVYEGKTYNPGPKLVSVKKTDEGYVCTFSEDLILSHGIDAKVSPNRDEENIRGFYFIVGDKRVEAKAKFSDSKNIILIDSYDRNENALTYAWSDCPSEANLYSKDRLPVIPFYYDL